MEDPAQPQSLPHRLYEAFVAGFCGLLLIATLDATLVGFRGDVRLVPLYWLSSAGAAALIAMLSGAAVGCLMFAISTAVPAQRVVLRGLVWGALTGLVALFILRIWDLPGNPYRLHLVVPVVSMLAGVVLGLVWSRLSVNAWCMLLTAAAILVFALDALVLRHLYAGLHNIAAFISVLAAALVFFRVRARIVRFPVVALFAAGALFVLFLELSAVRSLGVNQGILQPKLFRLVHALGDRDFDGYAAVLGGGDCDDSDPDIFPGRCEIPNNNSDDNCNGIVDGNRATTNGDRTPAAERPRLDSDVYIVVADAMRGDFGRTAREKIAPAIHAFARQSLDLVLAYTPYPSTFRAMISTLQGRHWRHVGEKHPTLFKIFAALGYDVQLFIADDRLHETEHGRGIVHVDRQTGDPFHVPDTLEKANWTSRIMDQAIAEMRNTQDPPRFRWLHLLDPHRPCMRAEDRDAPIDCYRREIQHVDLEFGRFWKALRQNERGKRAVVVLIADHGEEFGEHSGSFHGGTLFDEVTHVPMIMHLPGVTPRTVTYPASLLDLAPTLLSYFGVAPSKMHQGHDHLSGRPPPKGRVLSEVEPVDNLGGIGLPARHMAMSADTKVIVNVTDNLVSLYDRKTDPGEQKDIYWTSPGRATTLLEMIHHWQELGECRAE